MHVLFVAGWHPHKGNEHFGVFIKEHAEAVKSHVDLSVVHLRVEKSYKHFPWQVEVIEYPRKGYQEYEVILRTAIRRFGLHDLQVKQAFAKVVKQIRQQKSIDLIHLNVRMHLTKLLPEVAAIQNIPIVYTEHFTYYHTGIKKLPEEKKAREIAEMKEWLALPRVKSIMPVSQELANVLIEKYNAPKKKIKVVPNIAHPAFQYKRADLDKEKITIVLAALWAGNKHPILLAEALAQLPENLQSKIRIEWIGDGDYLPPVKDFLKQNLPYTKVNFHGFRPKEFIAEKLQHAHFLAHPTKAENLPCIIIESLCTGVPVLSNAVNGVPELIDESNGMLAPPDDRAAFAELLQKMLEHWDEFDREAIAKAAQSRFSGEQVGAAIFEEYKKHALQ